MFCGGHSKFSGCVFELFGLGFVVLGLWFDVFFFAWLGFDVLGLGFDAMGLALIGVRVCGAGSEFLGTWIGVRKNILAWPELGYEALSYYGRGCEDFASSGLWYQDELQTSGLIWSLELDSGFDMD